MASPSPTGPPAWRCTEPISRNKSNTLGSSDGGRPDSRAPSIRHQTQASKSRAGSDGDSRAWRRGWSHAKNSSDERRCAERGTAVDLPDLRCGRIRCPLSPASRALTSLSPRIGSIRFCVICATPVSSSARRSCVWRRLSITASEWSFGAHTRLTSVDRERRRLMCRGRAGRQYGASL